MALSTKTEGASSFIYKVAIGGGHPMTGRNLRHKNLYGLAAVLALLLVSTSARAGVNRWTPLGLGPEGGYTNNITFDPLQPQTVYAWTNGGIFRSTSAGAEWTRISRGLPLFAVLSFLIDPSHSQTLYACIGSGPACDTYKSTDGGENWSLFPIVLPGRTSAGLTAVDPNNSQVLYVNGFDRPRLEPFDFRTGNVLKSTDGGASWLPLDISAGAIVVDPRDSNIVYRSGGGGAIGTNSVSKSVNGGASWQPIFTARVIRSFTLDPHDAKVSYVGVDPDDIQSPGLWKSTDGGATWLPVLNGFPVLSFAVDPSNAQILYAVSDFGLYKTTDGGGTWTPRPGQQLGHFGTLLSHIAIQPAHTNLLLVATTDGVYKSIDRGDTWTESNSGLVATTVSSVTTSLSNPPILYATTAGTARYEDLLFKKTVTAQRWQFVSEVIDFAPSLAVPRGGNQAMLVVDPTNPDLLYVEGLRSTDGGKRWETFGGRPFWAATAIVMDPTNARVLYAANSELPDGYDDSAQRSILRVAIIKTTDGGQTWAVVYTDQPVCGLVVAPSDPQILYASAQGRSGYNPIKSHDAGRTWNMVAQDQPLGCQLSVDPLHPEIVYVTGENSAKSTDGGITWTRLKISSRIPFVIDPLNPQIIYAGTSDGVLMSNDGGNTWGTLNEGLTSLYVQTLAIDPSNPRVLYAGIGGDGVWQFERQEPISVTSISPHSGSAGGGTVVTVRGENFVSGATVAIRGTPATNVTVVNATTLTAVTPRGSEGTANIVVINPGCAGEPICSATLTNAFTYIAPPPPPVQLSTTTLNFGTVRAGKGRERSFTLKNLGTTTLTVNLSTTAPFTLRSATTVTLKPGKSTKVKVQFAPAAAQTYTSTVVVTDPATEGSLSVTVSGVGVAR